MNENKINGDTKAATVKQKFKFRNEKKEYSLKAKKSLTVLGEKIDETVLFFKPVQETDYLTDTGNRQRDSRGNLIRHLDVRKSIIKCNGRNYDIYVKFSVSRKKYLVTCGYNNGKVFPLSFFDQMFKGLSAAYEFIAKHSKS